MSEGMGFASLFQDMFIICFVNGIVSGFNSLGAYAYSSNNLQLFGVYYYKTIFCSLVYCAFACSVSIFFLPQVVSIFPISAKAKFYAIEYMHISIFFCILDSFVQVNASFLNIIEKSKINLLSVGAALLSHPIWNYIFVVTLDLEVSGSAVSFILTQLTHFCIIMGYILCYNPIPEAIVFPTSKCLRGIIPFLKYISPATVLMILEYWPYEVLSIIAMTFGDIEFGANVLIIDLMVILYGLSDGFGEAICILVSEYLISSNRKTLKKVQRVTYHFAMTQMIVIVSLLYAFQDLIIPSLNSNKEVIALAKKLMPVLCIFGLVDMSWVTHCNILRGYSQFAIASKIIFCCLYLLLGVLIYLISFVFDFKVMGNWLSLFLTLFICTVMFVIAIKNLDYNEAAAEDLSDLVSEDRDDGDEGVLQAVLEHHHPLAEPLGPGRSDVVLSEHLEELSAGEPHDRGRRGNAEKEAGDKELDHVPPGVAGERDELDRGAPTKIDGREHNDQGAEPEAGSREAQDGSASRDVVFSAVLPDRAEHADRDAHKDGEEDRDRPKLKAHGSASSQLLEHRAA
jgi:MATE family multidrug resistance protein